MLEKVEHRLAGYAYHCFALSEAYSQDGGSHRFCHVLQRVGGVLDAVASLMGGQWFVRRHELKCAATQPLFAFFGLEMYPRGHVGQLAASNFEWGREAERRAMVTSTPR